MKRLTVTLAILVAGAAFLDVGTFVLLLLTLAMLRGLPRDRSVLCDPGTAIAGAGAAGSLIGGITGSGAAKDAAQVQANAAREAAQLQAAEFQAIQQQLAPYMSLGTGNDNQLINMLQGGGAQIYRDTQSSLNPLTASIAEIPHFNTPTPGAVAPTNFAPQLARTITSSPPLFPTTDATTAPYLSPVTTASSAPTLNPVTTAATAPGAWDSARWGLGAGQQAALEQTPGYQFTLGQGLRATQNAAAATGRGVSGNALTAAGKYATGLADSTFEQQLQNQLASQGQGFTQTLGSQAQQFGQQHAAGMFGLGAQAQQFGQQQGAGAFNRDTQQQMFGQMRDTGRQNLDVQNLMFGQDRDIANLGMNNSNQQFTQALSSDQLHGQQVLDYYQQFLNSILGPQAQRYQQTAQNIYGPLSALQPIVGAGQNAAAMLGGFGTNAATAIGNNLTSGAAATAGGIVGSSNALAGGLGGAGNALSNYMLLRQFGLTGGSGGSTGGYGSFTGDFGDWSGR